MPCKPLYRSTHTLYSHNFALEGAIFALEAPYLLFALLLMSIRESIDWVWPMYCSIKSEIFGHAYMGMGILRFINASDFSNLPRLRLVRWFTRIALCFI